MKKSRFTESQIIAVLKEAESGAPVHELRRTLDITSTRFCKWRANYGGIDVSLTTRIMEL